LLRRLRGKASGGKFNEAGREGRDAGGEKEVRGRLWESFKIGGEWVFAA
jgi:hypothetical protein